VALSLGACVAHMALIAADLGTRKAWRFLRTVAAGSAADFLFVIVAEWSGTARWFGRENLGYGGEQIDQQVQVGFEDEVLLTAQANGVSPASRVTRLDYVRGSYLPSLTQAAARIAVSAIFLSLYAVTYPMLLLKWAWSEVCSMVFAFSTIAKCSAIFYIVEVSSTKRFSIEVY
jgi:hypothetical protein